jgi:PAS domain-containing protein
VNEFQDLLNKKARHDEKLNSLKELIKKIMDTYTGGLILEQKKYLNSLLLGDNKMFSTELNQAFNNPEIGSIICDENNMIVDISRNVITSLGYQPGELIGSYKGKLWVERPNKTEADYANNLPGKAETLRCHPRGCLYLPR